MDYPRIIQGGMGAAVSGWRLARAVGRAGQMGVVSGTALDAVHARRLADGDEGGHLRRAYATFPVPEVARRVLARFFRAGGRAPGEPYPVLAPPGFEPEDGWVELNVLANYAEVALAKQGNPSPVGINYLAKIQVPTPFALFGALLAGVDYVLMGAGVPAQIPGLLRRLARGEAVSLRLSFEGSAPAEPLAVRFDPTRLFGPARVRPCPRFLAIVSSNTLAQFLSKDPETAPDGFVVETPLAGGHNAPPRGRLRLDAREQPIYGEQDAVDLERLARLGRPFWLAGGYGGAERLEEALRLGAQGVQVGTAFAFCAESDFDARLKQQVLARSAAGDLEVRTDAVASPSGYPFKVVQLADTLADPDRRAARRRRCDLGYLRTPAIDPQGAPVQRCPAEPVRSYLGKGGREEDTPRRVCLCNALLAAVGLAQPRPEGPEVPIVTAGDDAARVARFLRPGASSYRAADVIARLLAPGPEGLAAGAAC